MLTVFRSLALGAVVTMGSTALVGCESKKPADDKMSGEKMDDKMSGDKMADEKMSDKMDDKMSDEKMSDEKMKGNK